MLERAGAKGRFSFTCYDALGRLRWREEFANIVTNQGKDLALDTFLAGSAYTVVGPFLGLISSVSFSAVSVNDTMASHAGWLEAGNAQLPTYSGTRVLTAWNAASGGAKSLSSSAVFNITTGGTIQGGFLCYGTGAVNTIDDTGGFLWSAGVCTGGPAVVNNGDVVNATYATSL